jgi:hypothetical protein
MKRCVHCSRSKDDHLEGGKCPGSSRGIFATMDLPEGQTCAGCGHFHFCRKFLGEDIATNTECDWFPVRFVYPAPTTPPGRASPT